MATVEFTGERILPEVGGYFFKEHLARYRLASTFVDGSINLIDVGCGDGYGSFILSHHAKTVTGIDVSGETIARARNKYRRDNLTYLQVGKDRWDTLTDTYDMATCFEVFEHIPDPEMLLKNINGALRQNGTLIISTPNIEVYGDNLPDPYHVREYTLPEFEQIVGKYFDIIEIKGQHCRSRINKELNFWMARQAMKHPSLMKMFNSFINLGGARVDTMDQLNKHSLDDFYFSDDNPAQADYFVLVTRKRA